MSKLRLVPLALGVLVALTALVPGSLAFAAGDSLPPHRIVAEDVSEQRRQVSVRIERRLREADIVRIGDAIRERQARAYARTIVSFFLPGQELQQGSWATVSYTTEQRVTVNGLRREDEDVLVAEHRDDRRPLLGSWLTSPPAAPGRLTIFSDDGRIFGEWRLRNGQKTVDELRDVSTRTGRRFEVPGGSTYVLTRPGDLEIWEKSTLIATADRIRPDHLALPASVAIGPKAEPVVTAGPARRAAPVLFASPAQPEPGVAPHAGPAAPSGSRLALPVGIDQPTFGQAVAQDPQPAAPALPLPSQAPRGKARPHKLAKVQDKPAAPARSSRLRDRDLTPGEQVAAKMGAL